MDDEVERVARSIASVKGFNPDATVNTAIRRIVAGRRTDTGEDRCVYEEKWIATPKWQQFVADAYVAIEAMAAAPKPE